MGCKAVDDFLRTSLIYEYQPKTKCSTKDLKILQPNIRIEWLAILLHVPVVPSSNSGLETGCLD